MSHLALLLENLGEDADLLARSEPWLEEERRATAQRMDRLANELRAIMLAQRIKRQLQQRNLVALQHLIRNESGEVIDIIIRLVNLPDAMHLLLNQQNDVLDDANREAQVHGWESEGYDVATSAALRAG